MCLSWRMTDGPAESYGGFLNILKDNEEGPKPKGSTVFASLPETNVQEQLDAKSIGKRWRPMPN